MVPKWYRMRMAMNLRLTDEEARALRAQAEAEDRSMQDVARAAVREYIARRDHTKLVSSALDELTPRYRNLLKRLGEA
ncbi:hypothetical protein GCM10010472_00110 [Pseudonocardia halophobica]